MRAALRHVAVYLIGHGVNPLTTPLTHRRLTRFAIVEHRGRRSGRTFATVLWHAPLLDRFTGERGSGSVGGLRSVDHPDGLQLEAEG